MKLILLLNFIQTLIIINFTSGNVIETEDAIIIEASRSTRDSPFPTEKPDKSFDFLTKQAIGEGIPCLTAKGHLGFCTSFRQCYPYFKVPDLSVWESWVLGNYDTCTYYNEEQRQALGVCCTNPITPTPPSENSEMPDLNKNKVPKPNKDNNYPSWPPPLPTHPPNHTPATHPPNFGMQTTQATFAKPSKKPTTWPTKSTSKPTTTKHPAVSSTKPTFTTPSTITAPDIQAYGCGAKNGKVDQERIVGGHNADPNEWPWIVALFNNGRQFCGGSLIDNQHILTAAHCVAHMSSWDVAKLSVKLGDHNIKSSTEVKHIERKVKRLVRHRGFDSRTLYNDVAVLTLDGPVKFTKTVRPICLPGGDNSRLYNGVIGTVIGWGSLRENGPQPAILQEVNIPIWTNGECKRKYGASAPGGIIDSMICAGQAAKDSCSGDSGGPLMVNDGKWTQVGVVSWGIGCGKGQYPGVYTRVTAFLPWITKNTKDN